jgi:hypothetical protein
LPRPAIDLSDSSLATALEQLASLQTAVAESPQQPKPVSTVVPAAPAPPVVALPIAPLSSPSDALESADASPSVKPWIEVEEQLATLANDPPARRSPSVKPGMTRRDLLVAATTAAAVSPLTWWFSRGGRPEAQMPAAPPPAPQPQAANARPSEQVAATIPALTGRITYVTADGESRPDASARILIFPENRQGSTLLSVDGFRANAAAADLQLARESMKLYGGAYAIADEHGRYGADLSSSGTYEVLIISNYQSRPGGALPADLLKALARYFDRPQQLIGQTAYEFTHLRFTGREPAVRDQVFQRA